MSQNDQVLVNRVANSGLITINLEDYYPQDITVSFDLKDYLFKGLILREKEFRTELKEFNWSELEGKVLCVYCSTDAIIPQWAYMLVAALAAPHAQDVVFQNPDTWLEEEILRRVDADDFSKYEQKRIVVKGCGEKGIGPGAYLLITKKLQPWAQSIMYGEPCSTVPIFKRPRVLPKKD